MGADLADCFDRSRKANPLVEGKTLGGVTEMTDDFFCRPGVGDGSSRQRRITLAAHQPGEIDRRRL